MGKGPTKKDAQRQAALSYLQYLSSYYLPSFFNQVKAFTFIFYALYKDNTINLKENSN